MMNFFYIIPLLLLGYVSGKFNTLELIAICAHGMPPTLILRFLTMQIIVLGLGDDAIAPQVENSSAVSSIALRAQESMTSTERVRSLQSVCSKVEGEVRSLLSSTYTKPFNCYCSPTSSSHFLSCKSLGMHCCGEVCGTVHWTGSFDSDGMSEWKQDCISYVSSRSNLNGKKVCHKVHYSGQQISSCSTSVNGASCNSCEVFGNLPYPFPANQEYSVPDCANIDGFGFMNNFDYNDVDSLRELEDLSLTCASGAETTNTNTLKLASAAVAMIVFAL